MFFSPWERVKSHPARAAAPADIPSSALLYVIFLDQNIGQRQKLTRRDQFQLWNIDGQEFFYTHRFFVTFSTNHMWISPILFWLNFFETNSPENQTGTVSDSYWMVPSGTSCWCTCDFIASMSLFMIPFSLLYPSWNCFLFPTVNLIFLHRWVLLLLSCIISYSLEWDSVH